MASIDRHSALIKDGYTKVDAIRSNEEAYNYVDMYEKYENRKVKRRWICKFCGKDYSGNIARIQEHLGGVTGNIASCTSDTLPDELKRRMAVVAGKKAADREENKKRKYELGGTSGSGPIYQGAAKMRGLSLVNQQDGGNVGIAAHTEETMANTANTHMRTPHNIERLSSSFQMENFQVNNDVVDGGNNDSATHTEETMANTHTSLPADAACQRQTNSATDKFRMIEHADGEHILEYRENSPLPPNGENGSDNNGLAHQPLPANTISTGRSSQRFDAGLESAGAVGLYPALARSSGNSPLTPNGEPVNDSNGLAHQPLHPNTVSAGLSSERSDTGLENAMAGRLNTCFDRYGRGELRQWYHEILEECFVLRERKQIVMKQQEHLEWINEGQKDINKWLEREGEVSKQYLDLFKEWEDSMSAGITMQLVNRIEGLRKETRDLIEESRKFDALTVKRVVGFIQCRLEPSFKDHLRVTLPVLLA